MLDTIRRSKTVAAVAVSVFFIAVAFVNVGRGSSMQKGPAKDGGPVPVVYSVRLISPAAGDVLVPGQRTTITWQSSISKGFDITWCEQEIYLSVDGGKSTAMRISPQLDPAAQSFDWVVPNAPTDSAVIDLRFGCEGTLRETAYPQTAAIFKIAGSSSPPPIVSIKSLGSSEAAPGDTVTIGWDSTVDDVDFYEIKVSYDQGAHFHRLAKTDKTEFSWTIPSDIVGHATFKVMAHTKGGEVVESSTNAKPDLLLRNSSQ